MNPLYESHMKSLLSVVACCFLSFAIAKAEENRTVQMWMQENRPVILVKEIDGGEWQLNRPHFYRDGFSGDGVTRLTIARVERSTDSTYKKGSLILFERRCEQEEQCNLPYWLIHISAQTPAITLTEDGTAFYVYGEDTYYFNAEELKRITPPSGTIWEQMKLALPS